MGQGMDPQRRRQIEALFDDALMQPTEERAAFVVERAAGDDALAAEVLALLAAHARADGILEAGSAANLLPPAEAPIERIGPYRVLARLGSGGMGMVYLAERDDGQFRRRVAIKLIRRGLDSIEVYRRFLAERQILAALDHPGIAKLLDGGTTEDGHPFLVMEYVEGLPIDAYCDRHRLNVEQRLRLFRQVCSAVHYAHQNLVIHRDLKPSNILVTESGQVKLLDFGIAKLLNPSLSGVTAPVTRTDHRIMTPEYASPEQVRGEALSTVSDVYTLGALLYELLCGHRPYRLEGRSPADVARAICEDDPERPSTRVLKAEVVTRPDGESIEISPAQVSAARGTTPERLRRRLRGDLDAIAMMALRKEPGRRYASAELLGQDIDRHLEGMPVLAHRGGYWYRAQRLVKRHRVTAAAAALAAFSLIAGTGVALWAAAQASRERDRAAEALDRAEDALARSEAVTSFLMGLFEASDPYTVPGDSVTARDLLRRGLARVEQLAGEPAVQAEMLVVVGRVYQSLGQYDEARELIQRALALRRAEYGEEHPEVASTLLALADVARYRGVYREAFSLAEQALAIRRQALGERHVDVAAALEQLASLSIYLARYEDAETYQREALAIREEVLGPNDTLVARSLSTLGAIVRRRGRHEEAEPLLRRAVEIRESVQGLRHPETTEAMLRVGDLLWQVKRDFDGAEAIYRRVIDIRREANGDFNPRYATALTSLAHMLAMKRDFAGTAPLFREALAVQQRVFGPRHPAVSETMGMFATALRDAGRLGEAEAMFRETVALDRALFGDGHARIAGSLAGLASTLMERGELEEGAALYRDAIYRRIRTGTPDHPLVAATMTEFARYLMRYGNYAAADSMLRSALGIYRLQYGEDHLAVRAAHARIAAVLEAWGKTAEAREHRDRAAGAEPWPR